MHEDQIGGFVLMIKGLQIHILLWKYICAKEHCLIDIKIESQHTSTSSSAAQCQRFKFDSISALSNSIFDIIGLARTSQKYHQRFLRTDNNYNFCINFIKKVFNILKMKQIFGNFVI